MPRANSNGEPFAEWFRDPLLDEVRVHLNSVRNLLNGTRYGLGLKSGELDQVELGIGQILRTVETAPIDVANARVCEQRLAKMKSTEPGKDFRLECTLTSSARSDAAFQDFMQRTVKPKRRRGRGAA